MIIEMKVPSPGESVKEVEISSWFIKNGDYVNKDQVIGELDSDKATLEICAQDSGIINIKVDVGQVIPINSIICTIDIDNTDIKKYIEINNKKQKTEIKLNKNDSLKKYDQTFKYPSPSAKKILNEKGIFSYEKIIGSGKSGRITRKDATFFQVPMGENNFNRSYKISKLSNLRKKISERLVYVKNETAMLTTFNEVDMTEVINLRNKYKDLFKEKHGVKLGFMSFFTKACVRALFMYPDINAMIDKNSKINFDYCDISIAIAGPKGLMVPVIRNCEFMSFKGIELEINKLSNKIKNNEISIDEMIGGTFTITNGGKFGSMMSTPIINPPQSAILGMHNITYRPVVNKINSKIEARPIMYIALSYDHRIIDGKDSVSFLMTIKESIENPKKYLINSDIKSTLDI